MRGDQVKLQKKGKFNEHRLVYPFDAEMHLLTLFYHFV